jgi:hypothetical protein
MTHSGNGVCIATVRGWLKKGSDATLLGNAIRSVDHLVGDGEELVGNCQAERPGRV